MGDARTGVGGVQVGVQGMQEWGFSAKHGWGMKDEGADLSESCRRELQGHLWVYEGNLGAAGG